jgi:hypothetical protein
MTKLADASVSDGAGGGGGTEGGGGSCIADVLVPGEVCDSALLDFRIHRLRRQPEVLLSLFGGFFFGRAIFGGLFLGCFFCGEWIRFRRTNCMGERADRGFRVRSRGWMVHIYILHLRCAAA